MPTPQSSSAARIARFGVFEADLSLGELRKSGRRVRLQEQPFQILVLLLERPGEIVPREEVRQKLWAADTFVDFDHSLNTAIKKVREALGDSASSPRYVETIARRGYRFLAAVEWDDGISKPAPSEALPQAAVIHPELEVPLPRRGVTRTLFGLIQVMYLAFYVVALFLLRYVFLVTESFLPGWGFVIQGAVVVTAGIGIPLRFFLLSSVIFDHRGLGDKFLRMFPLCWRSTNCGRLRLFLPARKLDLARPLPRRPRCSMSLLPNAR